MFIGGDTVYDEVQASLARIVAASDAARRRIERDLHDGAQSQLILLGLKLAAARELVSADPERARGALAELQGDVADVVSRIREISQGIYPPALEHDGLPGALRLAARALPVVCEVLDEGVGRHPRAIEADVYFCCHEALQNATKHAGPDARVTVRLALCGGSLAFEVADDGRGFVPAETPRGAGLQNMADRVGALGGSLTIASVPGRGTTVRGEVPLG